MSQTQTEKKVAGYLRKSQVLADHRHRPITAEQLQAEMDRMAEHTRQPEILREFFEALGSDPFVIAECLARPAVTDRLSSDQSTIGQQDGGTPAQRVEAQLLAHATVIGSHKELLEASVARIDDEVSAAIATSISDYMLPNV